MIFRFISAANYYRGGVHMLNLYYHYQEDSYNKKKILYKVDLYFKLAYKKDWMNDPMVKQIVLDIDNTDIIKDGLLNSRVFKKFISPTELSTGSKMLILMLKDDSLSDSYFLSDRLGENCFKWVFVISKLRDINLVLDSWFYPPAELFRDPSYRVRFVVKKRTFHYLEKVFYELYEHLEDDVYGVEIEADNIEGDPFPYEEQESDEPEEDAKL